MTIRDRIVDFKRVKASELIPNKKNWRTHPENQRAAMQGILNEVGYVDALLARELDDGSLELIDGHLRQEVSPDAEVPVIVVDLTDEEAAKVLATFDPLSAMAEADEELLAELLREIQTSDDALNQLLTDLAEDHGILDLLAPDEIPEDEIPDPPAEPVTQPGDLWLLGNHRMLCGDSTKREDVERVMDGKRADLWLSDPPYNVSYIGKTADALTIENDQMSDTEFRQFLVACFQNAFAVLKPGASFYIWHADSEGYNFRGAVHDCDQQVRQCLIWSKQTMVMGRQDYQWKHEPCLYGWKSGASHGWYSDRRQTTVLEFDRPSRSEEHPTMKPVALFAYQMGNSTAPQGLVFDPFLGSGTSIIAAEQLGRTCYGLELSPNYCDVIIARWQNLTGETAINASTGQPFPEANEETA